MRKKTTVKKTVTKPLPRKRVGRLKKPVLPHNATWLKAQLLIAGITQREVAKELGADFATVNHLITGRRPMRDDDAQVIAGMLKMPVAAFLSKLRSVSPPAMPEGLSQAVASGDLEITGWVDGMLIVHDGRPKGPTAAPAIVGPDASGPVRVVRCQTQGSVFDGIDGALVYFKELGDVAAESVGRMCVAAIEGGDTVLRVVKRGYSAGRFNLSMLNGVLAEEDARLRSASPVIWLKL